MTGQSSLRFMVLGTGGVGGFFGAMLHRAGLPVRFIARGAHLEALRRTGLRLRTGGRTLEVPPDRFAGSPAEAGPADVVLFCVKAYDTERAAERLGPAVGPDTVILPVQNGIDSAERIGRVVGRDRVIGGLAGVSSAIAA